MASPRQSRKILFLKGTLGSHSLRVNDRGGLDVCDEQTKVAGPIWDILSDASARNAYECGEIVTPYKHLVHEDDQSEVTVRILCTNDDTCLETTKKWLRRRETFVVHDSEKVALNEWLNSNFI